MDVGSIDAYITLLSTFRASKYVFCGFSDIKIRLHQESPFIVLRHDIDVSIRAAYDIAKVESEMGIYSTYFVMLRSPFYNVLSSANVHLVELIHELGHTIAAHVDVRSYAGNYREAIREASLLRRFLHFFDTSVVTLHAPGHLPAHPLLLYPPLRKAYQNVLRGDMDYISESTGNWAKQSPFDTEAFKQKRPIMLLTHPFWWVYHTSSPIMTLEQCLADEPVYSLTEAQNFFPRLFSDAGSRVLESEGTLSRHRTK